MNFSRFHQKRQDVLETKLHTCIFGECTSERKVLEHLRGSVTRSIFFVGSRNVMTRLRYRGYPRSASTIDNRAVYTSDRRNQSASSRFAHRREKCLFPSGTARSISRDSLCHFALFVQGLYPAVDVASRADLRETSRGAIAIGAGVHAILRADPRIPRQR